MPVEFGNSIYKLLGEVRQGAEVMSQQSMQPSMSGVQDFSAPGWRVNPEIMRKSEFSKAKEAEFGTSLFKRTIKLKEESHLSGMVNKDTFFGYDKNGESFTVGREFLNRELFLDNKDYDNLFMK